MFVLGNSNALWLDVTYVLFEAPLATLLKRLRPSRLVPCLIIGWGGLFSVYIPILSRWPNRFLAGAVVIGSGFVKNYAGLIVTRLVGCHYLSTGSFMVAEQMLAKLLGVGESVSRIERAFERR
jgi:hypothetical protein